MGDLTEFLALLEAKERDTLEARALAAESALTQAQAENERRGRALRDIENMTKRPQHDGAALLTLANCHLIARAALASVPDTTEIPNTEAIPDNFPLHGEGQTMSREVDEGITPESLEQILAMAFSGETVHAWPYPEPGSDYWTHMLDANSRHKLARIAVEIVWPLTEKARLYPVPDTTEEDA